MSQKKKGDNLVITSSILAIAQIVVRLIGLFYRVPLMRIVGDEGMGYYSLAYEVYTFLLLISSNGIPLALSLLLSSSLAKGEFRNAQRIFKCTMIFSGVIGGVFAVATFFGATPIAHALFSTTNVAPALRVIAPTIFISAILGVYRGYFQGKNSMVPTALSQVIEQIINAVVSVLAAWLLIRKGAAYGAAGSALGTCTGAFAAMAFCMLIYHIYRPTVRKLMKRDRTGHMMAQNQIYKLIIMTMIPIILSQTVFQLSGILDSSLYSKLLDIRGYTQTVRVEMYGVYNGEYKMLINVPLAISSSIGIALIPMVTRAVTLNQIDDLRVRISSIVRLTMVISIPCCVGLMVLAAPIIQLLFSDYSELPVKLMLLGAPTIALYSLSTVTISILQAIKQMRKPVTNSGIALIIHTVVLIGLLLFTDMNIYALVYGNYVFTFVVCLLNLRDLKKHAGYQMEYKNAVILPTIVSLLMGVVTWISYKAVFAVVHNIIIALVISVILSVAVFAVGVVVFGVLSEEDLYAMPKGNVLVGICKKFHIM